MITCTKKYLDFPFAHRQPAHKGHCSLIHGHNWGFEFTFSSSHLDECGFVIDFGKLKEVKAFLNQSFDHTLVISESDPRLPDFLADNDCRVVIVPDCSCEGLALWVFQNVNVIVSEMTDGRVFLDQVTVFEDSSNSATYRESRT